MADTHKFHPAVTINNIRNFIPITLELENGKYTSWAELFKIHCTAFQVLHHILPPNTGGTESLSSDSPESSTSSGKETEATTGDKALFTRLDAIVLQWISGTISTDLLHTILQPNATAASAWSRLRNIFQDNKRSRAVYLESQFTQLRLENFSSISSYCQEIKNIADQLANVEAAVSEERLVLQLISGLSEPYDTVATLLQQTTPLSSFYDARSRLILEETRRSRQVSQSQSPATALVGSATPDSSSNRSPQPPAPASGRPPSERKSQQSNGRGRSNRGRGRGNRARGGPAQFNYRQWASPPPWAMQPWAQQHPWAIPPSPYLSAQQNFQAAPLGPPPSPTVGILGPRPHQALAAQQYQNYFPTDVDNAMQAMTLHQPDGQWYMDTGASSHMTSNSGHTDRDPNPSV